MVAPNRSRATPPARWTEAATVGLVVVGTDLVAKLWAITMLTPHRPLPVIGDIFRLRLDYNSGDGFGLTSNTSGMVAGLTMMIIGALLWVAARLLRYEYRFATVLAIGLMIGGGSSNLIDRLPDQQVVDLFDAGIGGMRWPTFSVADFAVVVGILGLLGDGLLRLKVPHHR